MTNSHTHRIPAALAALVCAAPAMAQDSPGVSMLRAFFIQRNPRTGDVEWLGSLVVWLLLAMSVASVALIGVYARQTRRRALIPPELAREARALARGGNRDAVLRVARDDRSFLAELIRAVFAEAPFGRDAMLRALERAGEEGAAQRHRRIEILNILGSVAPMIGLFGTVYGMILAFSEIVASGGSPDPVGLAAGIGTALTTTFWGLVVAIPALAGFALIRNGVDALTSEAILLVDDMINHYKQPDAGRAPCDPAPAGA
ncbi:MAG: MotA/TolQ/ExbB proton channel family protein [Planctomycetota bacterium]|nr:MAG: MotA/TolQ/ExbB proton channel family protein [Planctomycetota bacterium]